MAEDWTAVARAISDRITELRTTQMEVAAKARISLTTLRELQRNISPRRRRPQTLAALSEALGWPPDYRPRPFKAGSASLTTMRSMTRSSTPSPRSSVNSAICGTGWTGSSGS